MNKRFIIYGLPVAVIILMVIHCERFELNRILKISTGRIINVTAITAQAEATIIDPGPKTIISHGHCWSTFPHPVLTDQKSDFGSASSSGLYTSDLNGLKPLTTYYVRAYAVNESDTVYGEPEQQFTTGEPYSGSSCPGQSTVADADGNVYNTVIIGGQCWMAENLRVGITINVSANPSDNENVEKYCYDDNAYNCENHGGLYKWKEMMQYDTASDKDVRGICPEGWHIPSDVEWKALESYLGMSQPAMNITGFRGNDEGTKLKAGGNSGFMALLGGIRTSAPDYAEIEKKGYYWSSTAYDGKYAWCRIFHADSGAVGRYSWSKEQALNVRCIRDTSSQIIYHTPTLVTYEADSVTQNSAVSGGNITDEGDSSVIARGVCWSLVSMPNLKTAMDSTSDGAGTGSFTSKITGLSPNNTYYVRAYARNIYGTSYGNQISFTTLQDTTYPTVVTQGVTAITSNSAKCGGEVTSEGGSSVIDRGVCLGFYPDLKLENAIDTVSQGSGTGVFACYLSNLLPDTMYFIRAFATNAGGTAYGALYNFRTDPLAQPEILIDIEGNEYQTVIIGEQVWMAENLRSTVYADSTGMIAGSGNISGDYSTRYYFAYNDNSSLAETYGRLYTWAAVMKGEAAIDANPSGVQGVCPDGWHVPGDSEWKELESYLGMTFDLDIYGWRGTDQGTQLKEGGSSGFEATMSGQRTYTGYYQDLDSFGKYWSTTDDLGTNAYYRQLDAGDTRVRRSAADKCYSLSVRCVKD